MGLAARPSNGPDTTPCWIKKLENISGPGIVVYSLTMTAAVIYWVMSMDVTWFSSVYGLLFLVGQGYSVLASGNPDLDQPLESRALQDDSCAPPSSTTSASSPSPSSC